MTPVFADSARVSARESLVLRGGSSRTLDLRVRYGLAIHPVLGPVLIDTGYTAHALSGRRGVALSLYGLALRPRLNADQQPAAVLARFGLTPRDVRSVIVTHFHADHVSGLSLFPQARFLASGSACRAIAARSGLANLRHGVFAELLPSDLAGRLITVEACPLVTTLPGLPAGHDLLGDGSMLAIDLPGHAEGHFGVLFAHSDPPILYATDAQWVTGALDEGRQPGLPASLIAERPADIAGSCRVVRAFAAAGARIVLCHDPAATDYDLDRGGRPS